MNRPHRVEDFPDAGRFLSCLRDQKFLDAEARRPAEKLLAMLRRHRDLLAYIWQDRNLFPQMLAAVLGEQLAQVVADALRAKGGRGGR
jgi:hypothetical protein